MFFFFRLPKRFVDPASPDSATTKFVVLFLLLLLLLLFLLLLLLLLHLPLQVKEKEDKDIKATTTTKTTSEGFRRMPAEVSKKEDNRIQI